MTDYKFIKFLKDKKMAALLPHKQLSINERSNGDLQILADGMSTDAGNRDKVLKAANGNSVALKYKDIAPMKRAERSALVKGMDVVYIYHDKVDEASHTSDSMVFPACDDAIEEIKNIVRIIRNEFSGTRVYITADHGFLYTYSPLSEDSKVDKTTPSEQDVEIDRRYLITRKGATPDYLLPVKFMDDGYDDETFENNVDIAFRELGERDPNHFAVRQWRKYKLAAGKTAKSINISAGARLAPFDIQELREITMYDELELDTLGGTKKGDTRKTVLFLIMSDTDSTFNFLISMIYSQLFNLLCEKADDEFGGRLPIHVRCLIDECANIGQIPNLEKLMATIRSREISACLVLQAQSQLKALYKDSADTIIGNCDTSLFLGGKEPTTLKELNQTLGKETIDTFNTGESRGREVSHSLNYQKLGKDLATVDELAVLDGGKCILQLRGVRPFLSDKYDITKHPNYKYLSDADKRNEFDIERFLSRRLKPKPDEVYDVYDIDASAMDAGETAGG